jgi:Fuc2NAc and GlcNAc transferase
VGMSLAASFWLVLLGGFGLSALATGWMARFAGRLGLVHAPNHRSSHSSPTPHGGGAGIVLAGTAVAMWVRAANAPEWLLPVIVLALLIAAIGLWDDLRPMPVLPRLVTHFLACLGALLFIHGAAAPVLSVALVLVGVWWLNLFNFMDGIDGLAGSEALFMLFAASILAAGFAPSVVLNPAWQWMFLSGGAIAGFLVWNWPPAKIFMGDVGSTYLGFVLFVFGIVSTFEGWLSFPVWLILGALFVADATITVLRRILRGERWMEAHRQHAYQRLSRRWNSHRAVTWLAIVTNLAYLLPLAFAAMRWPDLAWVAAGVAYLPLALIMAIWAPKGVD